MLLSWGDTNIADGDSKYNPDAYNKIEALSTLDNVVPSDTNRSAQNIYQTQYEIYKFLEYLAKASINYQGVCNGALSSEFSLDGDTNKDIVSVNLNGSYKHYARLSPGVAFNNGCLAVNSPYIHIAERQLVKMFNLEVDGQESITINYDYSTDKYDAVIKKKDSFSNVQTYTFNNGGSKYDSGVALLEAIYNDSHFTDAFSVAISTDLTKIKVEPVIEVEDGKTYYWKVQNDGTFEGDTNAGDSDEIQLSNFSVAISANQASSSSEGDSRFYFQEWNNFQNSLFFNVPTTWGDSSTTRDLANSDKDKIANQDVYFNFLRKTAGNYDLARFAWSENDIGDTDAVVPSGNDKKFYMDKDLLVSWGTNYATISNLAASIGSGMPVVATYNELPGDTTDGILYYVKDVNQIYRYASSFEDWITISDPKKQIYENTGTKLGSEHDAGDSQQFSFTGLSWKTDGSNLRVYKNGVYQIFLDGDTGDSVYYKILDHTTIKLSGVPASADKITASVFDGGSSFYPEHIVYTAGDSGGEYVGDSEIFAVAFNLTKDKVDVHRNGVLQRESIFSKNIAGGDTGDFDLVVTSGASFTSVNVGDFLEVLSGDNDGQITKITTVHAGDSVSIHPSFTNITKGGDSYALYFAYDYMVGEGQDVILLSNGVGDSDFIDIRDRATVIGSDLTLVNKGDTFPTNPFFGYSFYHTGDSSWYKHAGSDVGWVQI